MSPLSCLGLQIHWRDLRILHGHRDCWRKLNNWGCNNYHNYSASWQMPAVIWQSSIVWRSLWHIRYSSIFFEILRHRISNVTFLNSRSASGECIWTDPPVELQRTPREEKEGRVCWDYVVPVGTKVQVSGSVTLLHCCIGVVTLPCFAMLCHSVSKQTLFAHLREVYYQSKTDIYNKWNSEACCLSAASTFGSDGGNPNIVVFTATIGNFGFCECTAWDPSNPGTSCAGEATAENMVCPVLGAQKEMCGESTNWDGLPVGCGTVSSTASPSTTTTTTTASTEGCCYWDAETGCPGNDYCDQSKSNCEASCNGKWKSIVETTVSSTASVTTTPATTAKTTAATTATITTLPTTSTTETDMFEPVDGGVDRVCRGSTPTDNALEYFTVASHLVVRSSV